MKLDSNYWEDRYKSGNTGWDAGGITTPIKDYVDQLPDKDLRILIPGAGNSYEAEYLFRNNFRNVYVVDLASSPLRNLKQRLPDFPAEQLIQSDFFTIKGTFDLIIEQTFFCSLDPHLRNNYAVKMHSLLPTGGKLAGVLFDTFRNAIQPPFGGTMKEYQSYFENLFEIKVLERCKNSIKPRMGTELFMILEKGQNSRI